MSDVPNELVAKPQALIGLSGLDITNSMHRSIWDSFNNNRRPDGLAIQFKLLPPHHEFPTAKPKRNSYEWYIPKGILKRNWMNKYLNEVPSVVVFFYDLDWNDPMWNEKKMECASRVQSLRSSLEGRSTKIAVVLIQIAPSPPQGTEDMTATERATALCSACELPAKSLYILPHGDHLLGYTSRLENAFYELSLAFYHHHYRVVKGHREQLNKTAHQYLFVRHQYKMGFLNEMKQEKHVALKHYQHAYNNLLEIRMVDANTFEIKTVASFINYKLCRLMFSLNQPRDAISQFRAHIDRFRSRTGPEDIIFEHHAWMASQYSTFAELFDEAIRQGLPPVQTQHPGYYFQLAAQHASLRQSACKELCSNILEQPTPDPLVDEAKLEFYGQRPWRPGKHGAEPADAEREAAAIVALKYREKNFNHSLVIIGLLGNAISQFKIYRCPRMRRLLVVQMAAEYYNSRDYGKVLTLLMHMLWEYRTERWPVLLTDLLKNALRAAYLSTSIQDYITLAIEALGPSTIFTEENRAVIYNNIIKIISRSPPECEYDIPKDVKKLAIDKWNLELNRLDNNIYTIDDNNLSSFINVKASFSASSYVVGNPIIVDVFVRNLYEGKIEFSKILITVESFNSEFAVKVTADSSLCFDAKETKKYICEFPARKNSDDSEIRISAVSLYLGNENNFCIVMKFPATGTDTAALDRFYPEIQQLRSGTSFETIRPITTAEIKLEESSLNISVDSLVPALLNEWLPVKLLLSCHQNITNIQINMKQIIIDNSSDRTTELSLDMSDKQNSIALKFELLNNENPIEQIIYVRSHQVTTRNFIIKIDYITDDQIERSKEITYSLSIVKPFDVTTQFYTQLFEPLTKAFVNEPFIVMPHIICTSPWPIRILDTSVELGNSVARKDDEKDSILKDMTLHDGETATDIYCLIPKAGSEQPTSTGVYTIKWQRDNQDIAIETSISVTLSPVWVEDAVVGLEAKLPAQGWVQTPLCVSYFIKNHSDYLFTLRLTMESSDAFMFAGQKQIDICVRPKNKKKIEWILRPLVAGFVALPTLSLSVPMDDEHKLLNKNKLLELLGRSLPTHIYIMVTNFIIHYYD
ncbi:GSCOCG00000404001-RA-CDS [Cotesia congregata]|uniref:Similar to TRAPPC11: Trafficking protein particle complex subunit 11 (Gallus gallus) n=1 Tax=Cotesia congregata TaxID=51543 RepID=A0A8J2HB94_COTCN|nr:GSCOCG00000404001-RA-CDS [Cotesia congregata]CAG5088131.1 Similar to TRAPPC11: Trafficking protein particle complex subunit 11 (Gallus gallus) [Cotesia congregata]